MVLQTDALDEVEVGIENLARRMSADNLNEQSDDALHDECITVGGEDETTVVGHVALHPHAALTAVDEVLLVFILVVERLKIAAEVYE